MCVGYMQTVHHLYKGLEHLRVISRYREATILCCFKNNTTWFPLLHLLKLLGISNVLSMGEPLVIFD